MPRLGGLIRSLDGKVFATTLLTLSVMIAFSVVILELVVLPRFEELDRSAVATNVQRIKAAVDVELTRIGDTASQWGAWDDTYRFMGGENPHFVDDNLPFRTYGDLRLNAFYFYDSDDKLVWGGAYNVAFEKPIEFPEFATPAGQPRGGFATEAVDDNPVRGLMLTSHGPLFFAAAPILTSQHGGPRRGTAVVGRIVGRSEKASLRAQTAASLDFWTVDSNLPAPLADIVRRLGADPGRTEFEARGDQLAAYFVILGIDGHPALLMTTDLDRVAEALGRRALLVAEACLVAVALADLLMLYFLLRGLVLKPLTALEEHIVAVGRSGVLEAFPDDGRIDQFGRLAREFNQMIVVLETLHAREAEQSLAYKAALEASQAANEAKSRFLAHMSHELRTPLNAIIGFSEVLGMELLGPIGVASYKDYANDINLSGRHLLSLVEDLLDLSRAEAGTSVVSEVALDPRAMIDECCRMIAPQAQLAEIRIVVEAAPGFALLADPRFLKQMLLNLVGNAVKFTPHGGRVEIKAFRDDDGRPVIVVSDTGIGMSPEEIPVALQVFGQVAKDPMTRSLGVGLGLPLTKRLIELHGGSLELESARGCGTRIRLVFPATRAKVDGERVGYTKRPKS